jgi:hypothetical protein
VRAEAHGPGWASETSATGPGSARPVRTGATSACAPIGSVPAWRATSATTIAASSVPVSGAPSATSAKPASPSALSSGSSQSAFGVELDRARRARVLAAQRVDRREDRALIVVPLEVHAPTPAAGRASGSRSGSG